MRRLCLAAAPDPDDVLVGIELDVFHEQVAWVLVRAPPGELGFESVVAPDGLVSGECG